MIVPTGNLHSVLTGMRPRGTSASSMKVHVERGMGYVKAYWIEKVLKDKFAQYSPAKYRFARRTAKYDRMKVEKEERMDQFLRLKRPIVKPQPHDLVLFGDLQKELMGRPVDAFNSNVIANNVKTEMNIKVRAPHPMKSTQWAELRETTPAQIRTMVAMVVKEYTAGLQMEMAA